MKSSPQSFTLSMPARISYSKGKDRNLKKHKVEFIFRIFGGDYGSSEENLLEETLDQHEELRNRIVEANFKWRQAQLMVDYAFKQLTEVVGRWQTLNSVQEDRIEER